MVDSAVYISEGSVVAFQEVSVEFDEYPAPGTGILDWDQDQQLLMITTGAKAGAVHFRSETYDSAPPLLTHGWSNVEEVSVRFVAGDVRLLDLELAQIDTFPDESLVSRPGIFRARLYEVGQNSGVAYQDLNDDLVERYLLQLWPEDSLRDPTGPSPVV